MDRSNRSADFSRPTCRSLSAMACAWHSASASVALRSSAWNSAARVQCASQGSRESAKALQGFDPPGYPAARPHARPVGEGLVQRVQRAVGAALELEYLVGVDEVVAEEVLHTDVTDGFRVQGLVQTLINGTRMVLMRVSLQVSINSGVE